MEQAQNTFLEGLITDYNPIVTPNTSMTDALNATLITMNGNETTLQNDMGNARVETAFLPNGYVPVGIAEHAGIIYVASHNPLTNKSLIGSFPSPERILDEAESNNLSWNKEIKVIKTCIEIDLETSKCKKYDYTVEGINNPIQTFINQKQLFEGKTLHPGDKFLITWDKDNNESKFLSNYNNINIDENNGETKAYSPKNNVLTYKVMILDSGNNLIDITNTLKRFDINDPYKELKENGYDLVDFNTGYFMLPTPNDLTNNNKLVAAREVNFNTSATKITGKLYLAREYNIIDHIDVEYKLKGFVTDPNRMEAIFNITYYYNCPDDVKKVHEYIEPNLPSYLSLNSSYEINRKESEIHYSIGETKHTVSIKNIGHDSTPYSRDNKGIISIEDHDDIKFEYLKEDDFYYYKLNQEDKLIIDLKPDSIGGVDGATVARSKTGEPTQTADSWMIYKDLAMVFYRYEGRTLSNFLSEMKPEEISHFGEISGDKIIIHANTSAFLYISYNGYTYNRIDPSDTIAITLMSNFLHDTIQTSNTGLRLIKADKIYIPNLDTVFNNINFPFYKEISGEQTVEYTSLLTHNYNLKFNFGGNDFTYDELIKSDYITNDINSTRDIEVYNKFPFYFFTKGLKYIILEDEKLGEKLTINNDSQITDKLFVLNYKANEITYLTRINTTSEYPTNFTRHKFSVVKDISKTGLVNYNTETNLYNVTNSFKILINKDGDNYKLDKKIYSELDSSEISRSPELDELNAEQYYSDSFRKTYYRVYKDLYNYNTIKGVNLDFEIDENFLNYKITPSMTYSSGLTALIQKDKLDLTKLNSNLLEVTNWRYFVNDNDEDPYVELVLGLLDYTDERHYVSSVSVELYDVTRFSSNDLSVETLEGIKINTPKIIHNDDIDDYEEDPDYVIDSLQTGNHTTSVSFNDEFQQRKLYVCYIYYTLVDKNKHNDLGVKTLCAVRWMMTTPLFNGFYNTTADFNSLEAKDEDDKTWEEYLELTPTAWDVDIDSIKKGKEKVYPECYMDIERMKTILDEQPYLPNHLGIEFRTIYNTDIVYSSGFDYKESYYPDDVKYIKYVGCLNNASYLRLLEIGIKKITDGHSAKVLYSLEQAILKSPQLCDLYKSNNYWVADITDLDNTNNFVCLLNPHPLDLTGITYRVVNGSVSKSGNDSHSGRSGLGQITGVDKFIKGLYDDLNYNDKGFKDWDLFFIKGGNNGTIKLNQTDISEGKKWIFAIIKSNKAVGIDDNKRTVYVALPIMFYNNTITNEYSLFSLYFKGLGFLDVYVDGKENEAIPNDLEIYDKSDCNIIREEWENNTLQGNVIDCPDYISHLTDSTSNFANLMKFKKVSNTLSFDVDFLTKNEKYENFINYVNSIDENNSAMIKKNYYTLNEQNQLELKTYYQLFPLTFASGVLYNIDGTVNEIFNGRFKINYGTQDNIDSVIINANSEEYVNHGPYETTNPNNVSKVYYVDWGRKFYLNVDVNKKDDLDATHNYQLYLLTGLNIKEKDYGTNPDNSYFYIDLSKDPDSDSTFAGEDDAEY